MYIMRCGFVWCVGGFGSSVGVLANVWELCIMCGMHITLHSSLGVRLSFQLSHCDFHQLTYTQSFALVYVRRCKAKEITWAFNFTNFIACAMRRGSHEHSISPTSSHVHSRRDHMSDFPVDVLTNSIWPWSCDIQVIFGSNLVAVVPSRSLGTLALAFSSMAPKIKESHKERSTRLALASANTDRAGGRVLVNGCMKAHPSCIEKCEVVGAAQLHRQRPWDC